VIRLRARRQLYGRTNGPSPNGDLSPGRRCIRQLFETMCFNMRVVDELAPRQEDFEIWAVSIEPLPRDIIGTFSRLGV